MCFAFECLSHDSCLCSRANVQKIESAREGKGKLPADLMILIIKRYNQLKIEGAKSKRDARRLELADEKFVQETDALKEINKQIAEIEEASQGASSAADASVRAATKAKLEHDKAKSKLFLERIPVKKKEIETACELRAQQFEFARSTIAKLEASVGALESKIVRLTNEVANKEAHLQTLDFELVRNTFNNQQHACDKADFRNVQ